MNLPNFAKTRRGFLKSSSALVALPVLESLGFRRFASAAEIVAPPKRMLFMGMGFGVTADKWYPEAAAEGEDWKLPGILSPLKKHQADISFVQNLQHKYSNEGHWGSTFWLTGANRYAVPGRSFSNSISVDQVAAEQWGTQTRYTSLQFDQGVGTDGHGPGSSLAWNREGKSLAALTSPVRAFHKLFSDETMSLEERQYLLSDQRSVLDTILSDANSVKKNLTKTDKEKIDEYFQSIREIETRIAKEESWLDVPKKRPSDPIKEPGESLEGAPSVEMMYDIMLAAMQVDASRVFSYRMPGDAFIESLGAQISIHSMSHFSEGERRTVSEARDEKHAELIAKFIDKMKATKESDGSNLFDNVTLAFGSNLSSVHSLKNCPTLIAGGGSGFKQGQNIVMDDPKTPLNNLWLSMLQGSGIDVDSHGDSTGRIEQLFQA